MNVHGKPMRTIWLNPTDPTVIQVIDQQKLPFELAIMDAKTVADIATIIRDMHVRGAGLIGATAGYGMYLAALAAPQTDMDAFFAALEAAGETLKATRPTAVNLAWAVHRQLDTLREQADTGASLTDLVEHAKTIATQIADEDADFCRRIGEHGLGLIANIAKQKSDTVNILTHCNAGWLAFVDYGSATAPIYAAHDAGLPIHVWVDETRPRNQGASLTAWELAEHGVPHTVIVDNAGGHLMQHDMVDMVIVGSDRTTYTGDVGNKIGTYLKALAANDNGIPFYAALPSSTFDWALAEGVKGTPIEQRDAREVTHMRGVDETGTVREVRLTPAESPAVNYGFDVTPRRLVTGLITERGVCDASEMGILNLYPEKRALVAAYQAAPQEGKMRVVPSP